MRFSPFPQAVCEPGLDFSRAAEFPRWQGRLPIRFEYLYGTTSERKLVEELRMHPAWRWFTGLGFDQEIPHHSTFSKNRHGRFQESKLFEQLFEQIVRQCVEVGLVSGKNLSVDGSLDFLLRALVSPRCCCSWGFQFVLRDVQGKNVTCCSCKGEKD
ncbi:MAG: transposase [Terriglobales bacterium]